MSKLNVRTVVTALSFALAGQSLVAQASLSGQISGKVTDEKGAPLAGAVVVLNAPQMMMARTVTSDASGIWRAALLPPGDYRIVVSKPGYRGKTAQGVRLGVGASLNQEFCLSPVQVESAEVSVVASAATVDKSDTKTSVNFSPQDLLELTGSRGASAALQLAPGVTSGQGGGQFAIRGGVAANTQFTVNGTDYKDPLYGRPRVQMFLEDMVEDVAVVLSPANARYGRALGGAVNVVTKSGGNDFQGSLRMLYARPSWRARRWAEDNNVSNAQRLGGNVSDEFTTREAHATLTGPIIKDRLWFSFGTKFKPESATTGTIGEPDKRFRRTRFSGIAAVDALTATDPTTLMALPTAASAIQGYGFPMTDWNKTFSNRSKFTYTEFKLTGAITPDHRVQVWSNKDVNENTYATRAPIWLDNGSGNKGESSLQGMAYSGVFGGSTFVEFQASRQKNASYFATGSQQRDASNTPIYIHEDSHGAAGTIYNASLGQFAGTGMGNGAEEFNSSSMSLNAKLFRDFWGLSHDLDVGTDWYRSDIHSSHYFGNELEQVHVGGFYQNAAGNFLFPTIAFTGIGSNGQNADGMGGLAPVMRKFYSGNGVLDNLNQGFYINDQVTLNRHWNLMAGLRFDRAQVRDRVMNREILPVSTSLSPRFVLTFDLKGDSAHVFKLFALHSQGDYPASLSNAMFQKAESREIRWGWGPAGQPMPGAANDNGQYGVRFVDLGQLLDAKNYTVPFQVYDRLKGFNVDPNIKPVSVNEMTVEYRRQYASGSYARMAVVHREYGNIIAFAQDWGPDRDWITVTDFSGVSDLKFRAPNHRVFNAPELWRKYLGVEMEMGGKSGDFRYLFTYTYSRSRGNDEAGELRGALWTQGIGGDNMSSPLFNNRHWLGRAGVTDSQMSPGGALLNDTPHMARLNLGYGLGLGKGRLSANLSLQYASGSNWNATMATPFPTGDVKAIYDAEVAAYKANPTGYAKPFSHPLSWTQFYGDRGAYHQNDQFNADLLLTWEAPVWRQVRFFGNLNVVNLFNRIYQQFYNTEFRSPGNGLNALYVNPAVFGGVRKGETAEPGYYCGPRQVSFSAGIRF